MKSHSTQSLPVNRATGSRQLPLSGRWNLGTRARIGLAAAVALVIGHSAKATTYTWLPATGSAAWTTTGNWNVAGFPNAAGDVANFTNDITASTTVTLASGVTVGVLNIGDSNTNQFFTIG